MVGLCQAPFWWTSTSAGLPRPLHPSRSDLESSAAVVEGRQELPLVGETTVTARCSSTMTLSADEFMRRFLLHVLPRGFQRIRQFGLLANRRRGELARCRQLLGTSNQTVESLCQDYKSLYQTVTGTSLQQCPACRTGTMKFFSLSGTADQRWCAPQSPSALRLCLRPSIHRKEESRKTCHPSPVCIYSSLTCGHAELCLLRCKFVVRQSHLRAYPNHLDRFSLHRFYIFEHESFSPVAISPDDPLIQSP